MILHKNGVTLTKTLVIALVLAGCKAELLSEDTTSESSSAAATTTNENGQCGYYVPAGDITQVPNEAEATNFTADSSTSFSQTAENGQCFNTATIDLGSDFKTTNICTGKTIFGRPGAVGCVDGTGTGSAVTAGDILAGKSAYSSAGAAVDGTMVDRGTWNIETTGFPGGGYYAGITHSLNASHFCSTTSFLGTTGTSSCTTYADLHMSNAYRTDFATAQGGGFPADRPGATQTEEASAASNYLSKHRIIPDPADNHDHWSTVTGGYHTDEDGRPNTSCGTAGGLTTIAARISDCATRNGARATWEGSKYGQQAEATWNLVAALEIDSTFTAQADGTACTDCREVWRDSRTGLLWTEWLDTELNWFRASGYSCTGASCPGGANSSTTVTGIEGSSGQGAGCAAAEVTRFYTVADAAGSLHQRYFRLQDTAGSVGVWFDVGNVNPGAPAAGLDRYLEVNISTNDTATAVATAAEAVVHADAQFSVARVSNELTITDAVAEVRTDAQAGNSGFLFNIFNDGSTACQPSPPQSACAPNEILNAGGGTNGLTNYVTLDDVYAHRGYVKAGLNYSSTPRVVWRLPTQNDILQAAVDGIIKVHPGLAPNGGFLYWTADSSYSTGWAMTFTGTGISLNDANRADRRRVICVGVAEE